MKIKILIWIENNSDIILHIQVFCLKSNKGNDFRTDKCLLHAQVSGSPAQSILNGQVIVLSESRLPDWHWADRHYHVPSLA